MRPSSTGLSCLRSTPTSPDPSWRTGAGHRRRSRCRRDPDRRVDHRRRRPRDQGCRCPVRGDPARRPPRWQGLLRLFRLRRRRRGRGRSRGGPPRRSGGPGGARGHPGVSHRDAREFRSGHGVRPQNPRRPGVDMRTATPPHGIDIATRPHGSRDGRPIRLRHSGFAETSNKNVLVRARPTGRSLMGHASRVPGDCVVGGIS